MEASRAFHRCFWQTVAGPSRCTRSTTGRILVASRSISRSQSTLPSSKRAFSSLPARAQQGSSEPQTTSKISPAEGGSTATSTRPQANVENSSLEQSTNSSQSKLRYRPGERPTDKPSSLGNIASIVDQNINNPKPSARTTQPRPIRSLAEMLDNLLESNPNSKAPPSAQSNPLTDIYNEMGPSARQRRQKSLEQTILDSADAAIAETSSDNTRLLRLKPTLGRTLDVSNPEDLTRSFRMLEIKCNQNKVRMDERKQRTYVRRGQRKKDLRRQRWRTLFKEGFLAECARIRRMRRQGW